jgi:glycosyltransferase involved in cell wall biosynthesis
MINLTYLITDLRPAGAERIVYELATRLDPRRYRISVVCVWRKRGEVGLWLEKAGIPVYYLDVRYKIDGVKFLELVRFLKRSGTHILHCHLFHANLLGIPAGRLAGTRVILSTVHVAEKRFLPWRFLLYRAVSPWTERIICVSEGVRESFLRRTGIRRDRVTLIRNGIDVNRFTHPNRGGRTGVDRIRKGLGLPPDAVLVGTVGRLDPQKGHPYLIRAVPAVLRHFPETYFLLVGRGDREPPLRRLAGSLGVENRVLFTGFRNDIPDLLHALDIFLLPSLYEGLPLALIEAGAASLPVVATSVAGVSELMRDGDTGILVRPGDPGEIAGALVRMLGNRELARKMGERLRERIVRDFPIESTIRQTDALYRILAAERSHGEEDTT